MIGDAISVLVGPAAFFERADPDDWKGPAFAVGLVVLVGVLAGLVGLAGRFLRLPGDVNPLALVGGAIGLLVPVAFPLIVWVVYSVFFFGISAFFDGEGEFRHTMLLAGWGCFPA